MLTVRESFVFIERSNGRTVKSISNEIGKTASLIYLIEKKIRRKIDKGLFDPSIADHLDDVRKRRDAYISSGYDSSIGLSLASLGPL